ncbi:hypothetical protein MMC12_005624, partial [Toensbergia leucococca]|nr:hypothetical protein [Toensbergia leucococca]
MQRLSELRKALDKQLLISLGESVNAISFKQSEHSFGFNVLNQKTRNISRDILDLKDENRKRQAEITNAIRQCGWYIENRGDIAKLSENVSQIADDEREASLKCPKLKLQDLTSDDIKLYVDNELGES